MVNEDGAPKSAYELAMERLRRKDEESGEYSAPLTEAQRGEIAEARNVYEARKAEREILHQSAVRKAQDPESLERLEEEYRRDLERLATDRDRKIEEIRNR
jgi:hypothetical protein